MYIDDENEINCGECKMENESKNRIIKVVFRDRDINFFECDSWNFIHKSRVLLLNSIKETKKPRICLNMDCIKYFNDITENKDELDEMEELSNPEPHAV